MATEMVPEAYPQGTLATHWLIGVLACLMMLGSIVLHEGAHIAVSGLLGLRLRRVILFPFGGIRETEPQEVTWRAELLQVGIGPLSNLVVGVILVNAPFAVTQPLAVWIGVFNLALAAWNLIPAEPLDGIRLLHLVARKRGGRVTKLTRSGFRTADGLGVALVWLGLPVAVFAGFAVGMLLVLYGALLQISNNVYLVKRDPRRWRILHRTVVGQLVSNSSPEVAGMTIRSPGRGRTRHKTGRLPARSRLTGLNSASQGSSEGNYLPTTPRAPLTRWTLRADARLVDALEMLDRPDAPKHLLVVDGHQIAGVCSRDDLLDHLRSERHRTVKHAR